MYCCSEIYIAALKYVLPLWNMYCCTNILPLRNMLSSQHAHVRKPSLYSKIWTPPHKRVHNGLVPAPHPLTILITGSHCVPPLVPTRWKVLSMPKTFARSRRPLTAHQRVHQSLNAPPCALTVRTKFTTQWHTVGLAGVVDSGFTGLRFLFRHENYARHFRWSQPSHP